jgi:4-hydroxy-3-methylbut-2-enyl diphosphate reductase
VRRLEGLGAVFVEDESEIPEGEICVLSAHGVAPSVKENAKARGLRIVDATCPLVNKVHAEARRYADSGHLVALVGHENHVEVIGTLGESQGNLRRPHADDICYATQNRQDAVKAMVAEGATLVLVIGSQTSSNAVRLVEVAQAAGAQATLIDGESRLDEALIAGHETIGLTAGASTPEQLVQNVARELSERGYPTLEEITVDREHVHFRLPKEVARA